MNRAPLPGLGLQLDLAAVRLDQAAGQGEAEPRAGLVHRRVADLVELLEHPLLVLPRDAGAGVDDRQVHVAADAPGRRRRSARPRG